MEEKIYSSMELKVLREKAESGDPEAKKILAGELAKVLLEDAALTKKKWLEKNGFTEDGITYVVTGETYPIRAELKSNGFIYNPILKWHRSYQDGYEGKLIKVDIKEVVNFTAWGAGCYYANAADVIENKLAGNSSEWIGDPGDKLTNLELIFTSYSSFSNKWNNVSYVYNFLDKDGNKYTWFTSKWMALEPRDNITINAVIKNHNEYKGVKSTVITKVKLTQS